MEDKKLTVSKNREKAKDDFIRALNKAVMSNQLILPVLPEVALRVKEAVANPTISMKKLAALISTDPVLSSKILRVSNSALYGAVDCDNLVLALCRLGLIGVRSLVYNFCLSQLFNDRRYKPVKHILNQIWRRSTMVAAFSQYIAHHYSRCNSSTAMLGGLLHNIGALPILSFYVKRRNIEINEQSLISIIDEKQAEVGNYLLKQWELHEELLDIPLKCTQLTRFTEQSADFIDIVLAARVIASFCDKVENIPWHAISAFERLGIDAELLPEIIRDSRKDIQATLSLLRKQ